ncbi:RNA-binding protein NOB1 [Carex littledalei]|uniref:RNA-binding protein NOB1 n=1 Tax=Carex littledalei TaxID=544730 RepID=A0A833V2E9_9POAL|nr:RNA-binding protein NOB1 [Carex littledalei]
MENPPPQQQAAPPPSFEAPPTPPRPMEAQVSGRENMSKGGVAVAVVDANAVIHGDRLVGVADRYVSVREVIDEVRDPSSRRRAALLPFDIETMEPSPEFIKKVVKFARETGDLQTLSDVDIKLIALTYMLEAQIHGTEHLKESPPPLTILNVKNFKESPMPGWGSNVPNLAEWEALDQISKKGPDNSGSHILPLKDLDENSSNLGEESKEVLPSDVVGEKKRATPNKEVDLTAKKMIACGIDATGGEAGENDDDWLPAVSRSTHRRYLRRKARREERETVLEEETNHSLADEQIDNSDQKEESEENNNINLESFIEDLEKLDIDGEMEGSVDVPNGDDRNDVQGEMEGSVDVSNGDDGNSSEQSWMLRSLSDSSVACITSDFAMQNVLLQIGLRLLAPGGMQIRQLHRWVLKCHACNKVTQEIGRIFCPKCGNGGTLRKVSVTVSERGIILAARRQRFLLRGTKFSLPLPQGGREAISKNPVLREDQLPHKLLYPKSKKKPSKQDEDYLSVDSLFSHAGERREPLKPPVRKALAMFSGKRNPNDNHFSRRKV